jgi:Spb1 C-terminal domain
MLTGTKEIKKVAEARMRKKKRAANTLKAAKKSATMMAENSEMSEKQKLKVRLEKTLPFRDFACSFSFTFHTRECTVHLSLRVHPHLPLTILSPSLLYVRPLLRP